MISDPYKVLGVLPTASDEEIAKAYRRMAKKYHPDVNQGAPEAARKMSDINAAYEQIKSGKASQNTASYAGPNPYGSAGYGSAGANGPYGTGNNPYGDGSPFGRYGPFGGFGYGGSQQRSPYSEFDPVKHYIRSGYYQEALNVLAGIQTRSAEWYYCSAVANAGIGNKITALDHANRAVQMEPDNLEYQRVLMQIKNGGQAYQQQSQSYGMPIFSMNKLCIGLCLANLFCKMCGGC